MRQPLAPPPKDGEPRPGRDWRGVAQLALLLLFFFALAGGVALLVRQRSPQGVEVTLPGASSRAQVTVHISGAVVNPGVYTLQDGDRLREGVHAAGGFVPDADQDRLNLAVRLKDAERYHIPRLGEPTAADSSLAGPAVQGRINLNLAPVEQLTLLPGIGTTRAQAIVEYRRRNGPFQRLEDVLKVPGIGPATLERLRDLATVE